MTRAIYRSRNATSAEQRQLRFDVLEVGAIIGDIDQAASWHSAGALRLCGGEASGGQDASSRARQGLAPTCCL